jgi:hypothetical protein
MKTRRRIGFVKKTSQENLPNENKRVRRKMPYENKRCTVETYDVGLSLI